MENLENSVHEIVKNVLKLEITDDILLPDTPLESTGMNSMSFLKLVVEIESQFNIEFPDDKLLITETGTIKKLCDVIRSCVK